MKYYECINYDGWTCPDTCEDCPHEEMIPTAEGLLIEEFIAILKYADYIKYPNAYLKQQIKIYEEMLNE